MKGVDKIVGEMGDTSEEKEIFFQKAEMDFRETERSLENIERAEEESGLDVDSDEVREMNRKAIQTYAAAVRNYPGSDREG